MNQIHIMRHEPVVTCSNREIPITGRQGELFRLLVLHNGRTVRKQTIATLRETSIKTASSKVRYLRDQLTAAGCADLIETDRSLGYRAVLDGAWFVDAHEFRSAVEQLDGTFDAFPATPLTEQQAREEVRKLVPVLAMWESNPATGLPGGLEAKFDALKIKAENHLFRARLSTRQADEIREATLGLEHRRRTAAEDFVWVYLLMAYDAVGNIGKVDGTIELIDQHYGSRVPPQLQDLMRAIKRRDPGVNPFRLDVPISQPPPLESQSAPERLNADDATLRALCSTLGITTASLLRLEGSHLTPLACIRRTRKRLWFSGVLASKWVIEPAVRSELDALLSRLDANNGEARFLMINPHGDGFRRLRELRNGHISTESVEPLRRLAKAHPSLHVRVFDSLPAFRIVVIDDDIVSFSPYRLAAKAYLTTDRGWEAPHVALDPLAPYPLAEAFELLFLETWNKSTELGDE